MLADGLNGKVAGGWHVLFLNADIFKSESLVLLVISHRDAVKRSVFHVWLGQFLGQDGLLCLKWTINNMPCGSGRWGDIQLYLSGLLLPLTSFSFLFVGCFLLIDVWLVCGFELNRGASGQSTSNQLRGRAPTDQHLQPFAQLTSPVNYKRSCFYVKLCFILD